MKLTPSSTLTVRSRLQRKCACGGVPDTGGECAECRRKRLAREHLSGSARETEVPATVGETLRSPGRPLDQGTREFMESRFAADFSRVTVHTDETAAKSAWAVQALAYTVGNKIIFGSGQYAPETAHGRHLLSHELAHVVQQRDIGEGQAPGGDLRLAPPGSSLEGEADAVAEAVMSMGPGSRLDFGIDRSGEQANQQIRQATVTRGNQSRRLPLSNAPGFTIARAWDWRKAACHAACWGLGAGITALVAIACAAGSVVTIGGLAIPCSYAVVATAVAAGAGSSLCSDLCDHALAPPAGPAIPAAADASARPAAG